MKCLKYLLILVACFNLQTVIGNGLSKKNDVISKDVCLCDLNDNIVKDEHFFCGSFLEDSKIIDTIDTISINLSVQRDKEDYNEAVWNNIRELSVIFNNTFNNLHENNDSWIDELQNLMKTIYELVKDEKSIDGSLDVSLSGGDKTFKEVELSDEANELLFSFVVKRDKEGFDQEKWHNIIDSTIEFAKNAEDAESNGEFLSGITSITRMCCDFIKDKKFKN